MVDHISDIISLGKDANPYVILGFDQELSKEPSEEEIKKQFRKISLAIHPDKNLDRKDEAHKAFVILSEANEKLAEEKTKYFKDFLKLYSSKSSSGKSTPQSTPRDNERNKAPKSTPRAKQTSSQQGSFAKSTPRTSPNTTPQATPRDSERKKAAKSTPSAPQTNSNPQGSYAGSTPRSSTNTTPQATPRENTKNKKPKEATPKINTEILKAMELTIKSCKRYFRESDDNNKKQRLEFFKNRYEKSFDEDSLLEFLKEAGKARRGIIFQGTHAETESLKIFNANIHSKEAKDLVYNSTHKTEVTIHDFKKFKEKLREIIKNETKSSPYTQKFKYE